MSCCFMMRVIMMRITHQKPQISLKLHQLRRPNISADQFLQHLQRPISPSFFSFSSSCCSCSSSCSSSSSDSLPPVALPNCQHQILLLLLILLSSPKPPQLLLPDHDYPTNYTRPTASLIVLVRLLRSLHEKKNQITQQTKTTDCSQNSSMLTSQDVTSSSSSSLIAIRHDKKKPREQENSRKPANTKKNKEKKKKKVGRQLNKQNIITYIQGVCGIVREQQQQSRYLQREN